MTADFFKAKRKWSEHKDYLLRSYLDPYIAKVSKLRRPIVIVDCFAGQGRFDDGSDGSPLIIANAIQKWRSKGINVSGRFFERDEQIFKKLETELEQHTSYVQAQLGAFETLLHDIAKIARTNTVFMYVDPYTVKGLSMSAMSKVFELIRIGQSVEILMNFNSVTFMRWGLAALKIDPGSKFSDENDESADDPNETQSLRTLDDIAGGDYWRAIAQDNSLTFPTKIEAFLGSYQQRLLSSFRYVCTCHIKEKYHHSVPKYTMVYATRHPDGAELMNDSMCKAHRDFVNAEFFKQDQLFSLAPEVEDLDWQTMSELIMRTLQQSDQGLRRPEIRAALMDATFFGRATTSEMNRAIGNLLKSGNLRSDSGKTRINDQVTVYLR